MNSSARQLYLPAIFVLLIWANNASAQARLASARIKDLGLVEKLQTSSSLIDRTDFFEFHSGFWINLHHFLYQQAILCRQLPANSAGQAKSVAPCSIPTEGLSAPQQHDLDTALDYYSSTMVQHDLLFDEGMWTIKNRLVELEMARELHESGLNPELISTLERAAPIYRSHVKGTPVSDAIARECRARQMIVPRYLWHAIIFYTAGEIVRRNLQKAGNTTYVPYAYRYGIYAVSAEWQSYQRPLELNWQPYLDGKSDFENAIARTVDALKT